MTINAAVTGRPPHPLDNLNCVQDYLNKSQSRLLLKDVPILPDALLKQSRNCILHSFNNNDLLEFIGDRAVNLFAAVMVEGVSMSQEHHTSVRRTVCNNDTLGRIGFYLRFHYHAIMTKEDEKEVEDWTPWSVKRPPKVLADLFESYVGAVFVHYGWPKLRNWLEKLFVPIVKAATGDYWLKVSPDQLLGPCRPLRHKSDAPENEMQAQLLDLIGAERTKLRSDASPVTNFLPKSTPFKLDQTTGKLQEPFLGKVETAVQLINMWICQAMIRQWPEYQTARARAAHLFSEVTGLATSDRVIAHLTTILQLDDFYDVIDTSRGSMLDRTGSTRWKSTVSKGSYDFRRLHTQEHLAVVFKAAVGWGYSKDSDAIMEWGEQWFRPVVFAAHDILIRRGIRPILTTKKPPPNCSDPLDALTAQFSTTLCITGKEKPDEPSLALFETGHGQGTPEKRSLRRTTGKIKIVVRSSNPFMDTLSKVTSQDANAELADNLASLTLTATDRDSEVRRSEEHTDGDCGPDLRHSTTNSSENPSHSIPVSEKWMPISLDTYLDQNDAHIPEPRSVKSTVAQKTRDNREHEIELPQRTQCHLSTSHTMQCKSSAHETAVEKSQKPVAKVDTLVSATIFLPRSVRVKAKQYTPIPSFIPPRSTHP